MTLSTFKNMMSLTLKYMTSSTFKNMSLTLIVMTLSKYDVILNNRFYEVCILHSLRSWLHFSLKKNVFFYGHQYSKKKFFKFYMPFGSMNMLYILQILHFYFFVLLPSLFCPLRSIFIRFFASSSAVIRYFLKISTDF